MCKKISVKKLSPHSLKQFSVKKFEISVDHLSLQIKIFTLAQTIICYYDFGTEKSNFNENLTFRCGRNSFTKRIFYKN